MKAETKIAPLVIRRNMPETHTEEDNPFMKERDDGMTVRLAARYLAKLQREPIFVYNNLAVAAGHLDEAFTTLSHVRGAVEDNKVDSEIGDLAKEVLHVIKAVKAIRDKVWS